MSLALYGGPADGEDLACARAPRLLRVVRGPGGRWDACDLLEDDPRAEETIHVYESVWADQPVFHCAGSRSGAWQSAAYEHVISPPRSSELDAIVRDRDPWRAFVAAYFDVEIDAEGHRLGTLIKLNFGSQLRGTR